MDSAIRDEDRLFHGEMASAWHRVLIFERRDAIQLKRDPREPAPAFVHEVERRVDSATLGDEARSCVKQAEVRNPHVRRRNRGSQVDGSDRETGDEDDGEDCYNDRGDRSDRRSQSSSGGQGILLTRESQRGRVWSPGLVSIVTGRPGGPAPQCFLLPVEDMSPRGTQCFRPPGGTHPERDRGNVVEHFLGPSEGRPATPPSSSAPP